MFRKNLRLNMAFLIKGAENILEVISYEIF